MRKVAQDMVGMAKSPKKYWPIVLILVIAVIFLASGFYKAGNGFIERFKAAGEESAAVEPAPEEWDNGTPEGPDDYREELSPKQMAFLDVKEREMSYKEKRLEKIAEGTNKMIDSIPNLLTGIAALIGAIAAYRKTTGG